MIDRAALSPAALIFLFAIATGCGADHTQTEDGAKPLAPTDTAATETFAVAGRIMSITPDRDFLMVRHDAIDGFMDAMTMPFAVGDTALVTGIAAGDSVGFVIEVSRGDVQITWLEKRP
ncbi:MAG TPA: copper-binding protein [Rhodothermia bacterium]|nr:copper-binding protein [Rhodothermia bacterium]